MLAKEEESKIFFNQTNNYLHKNFGVLVRADIVKDILGEIKGKRILDLGCGDGGVTLQFAKDNQLTLVDLSENMLELAKINTPIKNMNNVTYLCTSLSEFNSDEKFDVVIAIGLLAHVPSIEMSIKQMISLVKKNGIIIIQFSDCNSWITKFRFWIKDKSHTVNQVSRFEMISLSKLNKASIEQEIKYSFLPPGIGKLPNSWLYFITKMSYKKAWLSRFGSDFIWKLKVLRKYD